MFRNRFQLIAIMVASALTAAAPAQSGNSKRREKEEPKPKAHVPPAVREALARRKARDDFSHSAIAIRQEQARMKSFLQQKAGGPKPRSRPIRQPGR